MKTYTVTQNGIVEKPLKDKIQLAQGKKSKEINRWNLRNVLMAIAYESEDKGSGVSFSDLLQLTRGVGISTRQTLAKHVHKLEELGLVYEDTVKPWDNTIYGQGQVIFKVNKPRARKIL